MDTAHKPTALDTRDGQYRNGAEGLARLRRDLDTIPLARAMDFSITGYDGEALTLAAPLAPNINDKGCAFGGSLVSLMTLAGWGLAKLATDARGIACDIYIRDSAVRYLAPVWEDFTVVARIEKSTSIEQFFATFAARGKARFQVHCTVPLADGSDAATLDGTFVALARS